MRIISLSLLFVMVYGINIVVYQKYVDELLNYHNNLPEVFNPILKLQQPKIQKKAVKIEKKEVSKLVSNKKIENEIVLLGVLNDKALLRVGDTNEKWLQSGDMLDGYQLVEIISPTAVLVKYKKKVKIITNDNNDFNIKVKR